MLVEFKWPGVAKTGLFTKNVQITTLYVIIITVLTLCLLYTWSCKYWLWVLVNHVSQMLNVTFYNKFPGVIELCIDVIRHACGMSDWLLLFWETLQVYMFALGQ